MNFFKSLVKINYSDWLLIFAIVLSPQTGFRIYKIGPSELMILLWIIGNHSSLIIKTKHFLSKFWIEYLFLSILGTAYCLMFFPNESTPGHMITWFVFAVFSITIYDKFQGESSESILIISKWVVVFTVSWYGLLYGYSLLVSNQILGVPLWYSNVRFSGAADNPHQLAVLLTGIVPLLLFFIVDSKQIIDKIIFSILIAGDLFLIQETQSSTAYVAIVLTLIFMMVYQVFNRMKNKQLIVGIMILLFFSVYLIFENIIYLQIHNYLLSDENGLGRVEIFQSFEQLIEKNIFFGLGPGTHALNGMMEFHNNYLEVLAMTGILGFYAFGNFTLKLYNNLQGVFFKATMIIFYAYGLAGFSMRRASFWGIITILLCYKRVLNERSETDES